MSYSIDVNGNDNQPEWGYCDTPDCGEEAFPIWTSGEYPDDPDLLLCPTHIGARLFELEKALRTMHDRYHCKVADPIEDLADTDEAAERIWKAGHMTDLAVYDMLVAALKTTDPPPNARGRP